MNTATRFGLMDTATSPPKPVNLSIPSAGPTTSTPSRVMEARSSSRVEHFIMKKR
uniref:Uncharacterized protein n=1 Tax=Cucumis melo TaxID=3656 RepID=A0A9I9EEB7_CUCME